MEKSENKYRSWVLTWNETSEGLRLQTGQLTFLLERLESVDKFVFQLESGTSTHREHFQGAFQTNIRIRQTTLLKQFKDFLDLGLLGAEIDSEEVFKQLTINRMCGTWEENFNYCTKSDTRAEEPSMSSCLEVYNGSDVSFLKDKEKRFPWQNSFIKEILDEGENSIKDTDDRKIIWIWDPKGNSGKSKLIKYLCVTYNDIAKISFGTSAQLRSGLISMGKRDVYIVDMPRTRAEEDSIPSLVAALEDLKNGYLVTCMYGKYAKLMMSPPHVVVFSNEICPKGMMSEDRWASYRIESVLKTLENC